MIVPILFIIFQKVQYLWEEGPEKKIKNSMNPINRATIILGLIPRFCVWFHEWDNGDNSCYTVAFQVVEFVVLVQRSIRDIST